MTPSESYSEVVLVHGTFAADTEAKGVRWWQEGSFFWEWLNTRCSGQAACLKTFHWSGRNRERDRRSAGKKLYARLLASEQGGRSYHLVGHSHGGSVIWNALRIAARKRQPLNGLKSWTTVGTPFFAYRPRRGDLIFLIPMAIALLFAPRVLAQMVITIQCLPAMWAANFDWTLLDLMATWAIWWFALGVSTFRVGALAWGLLTRWPEQRSDEKAYSQFGPRWKGIWSPEDEAIRGLQSSVVLDLRDLKDEAGKPLRIIPPPRLPVVLQGFNLLGDRLVFEWVRRFVQGNDHISQKLDAVSAGPLPWVESEPLADDIHRKLVKRVIEDVDFSKTFERLRKFLGDVAFGGPFVSPFKDGTGKPSVFNSILIHTLYLPERANPSDQGSAPLIAEQVANHIILRSTGAHPAYFKKLQQGGGVRREADPGSLFGKLLAATAVQRTWSYGLMALIFLMAMASNALFDWVREFTPEFQVNKIVTDVPEDQFGGLLGEIAGADDLKIEELRAPSAIVQIRATWCRSLFSATRAKPKTPDTWRSWAILPPTQVFDDRAEKSVARIEDINLRANARAAIAESLTDPASSDLVRKIANDARTDADHVDDRADRVATIVRIARLYPRGDIERTHQARDATQVAMRWLEERASFQKQTDDLRRGDHGQLPAEAIPGPAGPAPPPPPADIPSRADSNKLPRTPPQEFARDETNAGQLIPQFQQQQQVQAAPAKRDPKSKSFPTPNFPVSANEPAQVSAGSGSPVGLGDVSRRFNPVPFSEPEPEPGSDSRSLDLTPSNSQKLIQGIVDAIEILDESDHPAAILAATRLAETLQRIEEVTNRPPEAHMMSKAQVLQRKIYVLKLSHSSLIRLAHLEFKLKIKDRQFNPRLQIFSPGGWEATTRFAEDGEAILANLGRLREIGREPDISRVVDQTLAISADYLQPVTVAALADDLVRAANLSLLIGRRDEARKAIDKARSDLGRITASSKLIGERDWVQLEDLRDNRQKVIDRYILFRVRVRIGLADLLWRMEERTEASALLREAWDDALTVGMLIKDGNRVSASKLGPNRQVSALGEVIASEARMTVEGAARCVEWIEEFHTADPDLWARLLGSEEGGRALRQAATASLLQNRPDDAMAIAELLSSRPLFHATWLDVADWYAFPDTLSDRPKNEAKAEEILEVFGKSWEKVARRRDRSLLASRVATLWAHLGDPRKARLAGALCLPEDRLPAYAAILDAYFDNPSSGPARRGPLSVVGVIAGDPRPRPALDPKERELASIGVLPDDAIERSSSVPPPIMMPSRNGPTPVVPNSPANRVNKPIPSRPPSVGAP